MNGRAVLAAAGISLIAGTAAAQEKVDPLAAEAARYRSFFSGSESAAELDKLFPEGFTSQTKLRVGTGATYTDNVDRDESQRSAVVVNGIAGAEWLRRSQRFEVDLNAQGSTPLYASQAVEGRQLWSAALAGVARWTASQYFVLSGGGSAVRNAQAGLTDLPVGVTESYRNRFDDRAGHAEASWRAGKDVTASSSYVYHRRRYKSPDAEGENSWSQGASARLNWTVTPKDSTQLGGGYTDERGGTEAGSGRRDFRGDLTWTHALSEFLATTSDSIGLYYGLSRSLSQAGEDYWVHTSRLQYARAWPTGNLGANVGGQWIERSEGKSVWSWNFGGNAETRFSERTRARLAASQSWDYAPATSQTERTEITRLRRVSVGLDSRLTQYWTGSVSAAYEASKPESDLSGDTAEEYWQVSQSAALRGGIGKDFTGGIEYQLVRRLTKNSTDDFALQSASLSGEYRWTGWLLTTLRYSFERKSYDSENSDGYDDYTANTLTGTILVTW